MSCYHAKVYDLPTGRFLLKFSVEASDLHEAETAAIQKAARMIRAHPLDMEVRHLHQEAERSPAVTAARPPRSTPGSATGIRGGKLKLCVS